MYIYTITTVELLDDDVLRANTRCVGWTSNFFDAERIIIKNIGNINEDCYNYAVIEEIAEGIYQSVKQEWWYVWDNKIKGYRRIKKPATIKMFSNLSIG